MAQMMIQDGGVPCHFLQTSSKIDISKTPSLSSALENIFKETMHATFPSTPSSKIKALVTKCKNNKLNETADDEISMIIRVHTHMNEKT